MIIRFTTGLLCPSLCKRLSESVSSLKPERDFIPSNFHFWSVSGACFKKQDEALKFTLEWLVFEPMRLSQPLYSYVVMAQKVDKSKEELLVYCAAN